VLPAARPDVHEPFLHIACSLVRLKQLQREAPQVHINASKHPDTDEPRGHFYIRYATDNTAREETTVLPR
jgi:hypothetical protein